MASLNYDPARSVNPELANGNAIIEGENLEVLELADAESQAHGFQYICTLNSDYVPRNEFSPGFRMEDFIRLRLTDANVAGCLMGVRF